MNNTQSPTALQRKRPPRPPVAKDKAAHWYQHINRYWQRYLSGTELKLLLFILNAQLGWRSIESKWISRRAFADGVVGKNNGRVYHEGTGLAGSTIDAGLSNLEKRGIIFVRRVAKPDQTECRYSINWDWNPNEDNRKATKTLPRKSGRAPRNSGNPQPEIRGQRESEREVVNNPDSQPLPETGGGDDRKSEEAEERSSNDPAISTHSRDYTDISDPDPHPDKLQRIWNAALSETFPTCPVVAWKEKERGQVRGFCSRYNEASNRTKTFGQFIDWAVRNWRYVMHSEFRRMTVGTDFPNVGFLVYFDSRFIDVFAKWDELSAELAMGPRALAIKRLTEAGVPYEVAVAEVDAKMGIMEERVKLQKATLELKQAGVSFERQRRMNLVIEANRNRTRVQQIALPPTKVLSPEEIQKQLADMPDDFGPFVGPEEP